MLQRQRVLTADPSFVGCGGGTSCSFIGSGWFGLPACRNSNDRLHDNDTLETNGTHFQTFSANRIKDATKYYLPLENFSSLMTTVFQH